ncbi:hypothetical protein ACOBQX_18100 [Actinokineospora sp. G85]|uniref:hypothetical protein n=1 Tax=Actinokineospora sp. G85 TaxID=3406626 RepID=UPI003C73A611
MHLWLKPLPEGDLWGWLAESPLEPAIFTPEKVKEAASAWRKMLRLMKRNKATDEQIAIIGRGANSGEKTVFVFGLVDGRMTYWRAGETLEPVPLDQNAVEELISTWESVGRRQL